LAVVLTFWFVLSTSAYDYRLSPETVREAYYFGRSSDRGKVAEFLGQYIRVFPSQDRNTLVVRIELRTPYQRVVQQSWDNQADYRAQQAERDSAAQSEMVEVRLYLVFDNSHPEPRKSVRFNRENSKARPDTIAAAEA
jgi:hypothetical protein